MIPGTNVYMMDVIKQIKIVPQVKSFQHADGTLVLKIEGNKNPDVVLSSITKQINSIIEKNPNVKMTY
jgi:hypothetical protein